MYEKNLTNLYPEGKNKEELVVSFLPVIKKMAGKLGVALPPSLDERDLIGSGIIGLLEALQRYDPSRKVEFASYAAWRIKGAMIDELRKVSFAPRSFFNCMREIQDAEHALRQELGRDPTEKETQARLGWPTSKLSQVWAYYNLLAVVSLDNLLFGGSEEESYKVEEVIAAGDESPEEQVIKQEKHRLLAAAIEKLPAREKMVLSLYYEQDLTQKEIAKLMHISAARVSQLHARAIHRLRVLLLKNSWRMPSLTKGGTV